MTPARGRRLHIAGCRRWSMAHRRVLVTGFEPFGGHTVNISQEVVRRLEGAHERPLDGASGSLPLTMEVDVLTVDAAGARRVAERLEHGERWDAILHLGLCDSCDVTRLEVRGADDLSMRIPDNAGRQVASSKVTGLGDVGARLDPTVWPVGALSSAVTVSHDAGAFICNETYHRTLMALHACIDVTGLPVPCLFVHLPSHERMAVDDAVRLVMEVLSLMLQSPPLGVDVVAGVVPTVDGRVLIARRGPDQSHAGAWEFPGGKIEPGEHWREALVREWVEELSIRVRPTQLIGSRSSGSNDAQHHVHAVLCEPIDEAVNVTLSAHDAWLWWLPQVGDERPWVGRNGELADELAGRFNAKC